MIQPCGYEMSYIQEGVADIEGAMEEGVKLHELKEWYTYALMQTGIELT